MSTLRYRSNVGVEDLGLDECTVHRACNSSGARWWLLWFRVNRDSDGQPDDFAVPINPNGGWIENGPGGKTWGLIIGSQVGTWQVSPSINVVDTREPHPGAHEAPSLWHQTPRIVDVPASAAWVSGAP